MAGHFDDFEFRAEELAFRSCLDQEIRFGRFPFEREGALGSVE